VDEPVRGPQQGLGGADLEAGRRGDEEPHHVVVVHRMPRVVRPDRTGRRPVERDVGQTYRPLTVVSAAADDRTWGELEVHSSALTRESRDLAGDHPYSAPQVPVRDPAICSTSPSSTRTDVEQALEDGLEDPTDQIHHEVRHSTLLGPCAGLRELSVRPRLSAAQVVPARPGCPGLTRRAVLACAAATSTGSGGERVPVKKIVLLAPPPSGDMRRWWVISSQVSRSAGCSPAGSPVVLPRPPK
jgi:hypothetical protein